MLTATVVGGSLTVVSSPPGFITCQPSIQIGGLLQTTCRVAQAAAGQQYLLEVTWLTAAQQTSIASTILPVVSAGIATHTVAAGWVGGWKATRVL
jgi:hypothetical protein